MASTLLKPKSKDTTENRSKNVRAPYWKEYIKNNLGVEVKTNLQLKTNIQACRGNTGVKICSSFKGYQIFYLAGVFESASEVNEIWLDNNYLTLRENEASAKIFFDGTTALVVFDNKGEYVDDFQMLAPLYDNSNKKIITNAPDYIQYNNKIVHTDVPFYRFRNHTKNEYKVVTESGSAGRYYGFMIPGIPQGFHQGTDVRSIGCSKPPSGDENNRFVINWLSMAAPNVNNNAPASVLEDPLDMDFHKPTSGKILGIIRFHFTESAKEKGLVCGKWEEWDNNKPRNSYFKTWQEIKLGYEAQKALGAK